MFYVKGIRIEDKVDEQTTEGKSMDNKIDVSIQIRRESLEQYGPVKDRDSHFVAEHDLVYGDDEVPHAKVTLSLLSMVLVADSPVLNNDEEVEPGEEEPFVGHLKESYESWLTAEEGVDVVAGEEKAEEDSKDE